MSFIKHRERMFHKSSRSISKKRSDTNLRRMSSCNDVRAWSLNADSQRQYFLDSINSKSSSFGKFVPPDVLIDILRKQNGSQLKKLNALKRTSSEEIIRKKPKEILVKKRSRINNFDQGDYENLKDTEEISNLRNMVKDMESRFSTLKKLEDENSKLKSIINLNNNENNDNNSQLVCSKDSLVHCNQQCNHLADTMSIMKDQCSKMRLDVEYLQSKNFKLSRKLKKTLSNERLLKDREFIVSMESVNNAILKGKVESKEMKIQRLLNVNEEQKHQIDHLTSQINELTVSFSWKEELLLGKLLELKNVLKTGSEKIIKYENRISLCHQVIREMDLLSQYFRLVNATLKENAGCYKARLRLVGNKALDMTKKIDFLLQEITKRDEKINQLSKFPGRTSMAVHLGQLDDILRGDFLYQTNKIAVVETFEKLKKILENLKTETWDNYGIDRPYLMNESSTQTQVEVKSSATQHCVRYKINAMQTEYPDEFITKFITYCLFNEIFKLTLKNLKRSLKTESQSNEYLRNIASIYSDEIKSKNSELEISRNCNKILEDEIINLKKTINESNQNIIRVTENYEFEEDCNNSLDYVYKSSSELTIKEYENYCSLLENTIYNNEENIEKLADYVENELYEQKWNHFQYFSKLENRYDLLKSTLENQLRINDLLKNEIKLLTKDLINRDDLLEKVTDLWYFAEDEKELLKESLKYQEIACCDRCCNFQSTGVQVIFDEEIESEPIEIEPAVTEYSTCDSSISVLNQPIESKIHSSISNCKKIRGIFHKNRSQERVLKIKLTKINVKVKRIVTCMIKFKNKLEVSILSLNKLKEINMELTDTNKNLHSDNIKLSERNIKLKENISLLKILLKSEIVKTSQLQKTKVKLLMDCQKLQLKIQDQIKESCTGSVNTDVVMYDYLEELECKNRSVNQLKSRIETLVELLKEIQLEKKMKEENMNSISLQTDLGDELHDKYLRMIKEISISYEQSLERYKKLRDEEMENKEINYRKNLSSVNNTAERDMARLKKNHQLALRKIQSQDEEEIRNLKKIINKLNEANNSCDHKIELEKLKLNYDTRIKELNDSIIKEKEVVQEKMKLYMHEKEQQVEEITKNMAIALKQMKKKCKMHVRRIQQENNCNTEEIKNDEQNNKSVDDLQSIDSDVYFRSSDKDFSVMESLDSEEIHIRCKGDDDSLILESTRTVTSGFDEDMYDVASGDDRRYLIKRINLLEDQLSEKEKPSPENACDSEKRVWIERERCKEVTQLLDKEIEKNENLKQKLNEEKQRTKQLDLENQALKKSIESLKQKNENNTLLDPFQINDKDQLINNKYEALLDDYGPISMSGLSSLPSYSY